jgi:peptidoglycan/LPS O-acetylase OafA/YrhL
VLAKEPFMNLRAAESDSSKQPRFSQAHELAGIEVLRFLCALAILICHYQHFFFVGAPDDTQVLAIRPMFPAYWLLRYLYEHGWYAVQVFWCISGFIFYWRYAHQISDCRVGIGEFVTRRFSRLYPLHFVTLLLVAALQYLYFRSHGQNFIHLDNSAGAFFTQLLFASNWFTWQGGSFNGSIWSISVEILVYFGFFYIVRALGANPIVAAVVSGAGLLLFYSSFSLFHMKNVCECAVLFFAGGAIQFLTKQRLALLISVFLGTVMIVLLAADVIGLNLGVMVILDVCLVVSFARFGEMKCGSVFKHIAFLGNATYSSYLVHFPIQLGMVMALDYMGFSRTVFFSDIALVTYLGLVISISLVVYYLFESPAQDWLRSRACRTPPSNRGTKRHGRSRHHLLNASFGQRLGQCGDGELLLVTEDRALGAQNVSDT